jgi:hypothetical protein
MQQRDAAKTLADADKANIEALNASFELAKTRLGFAELVSPLNGYVLVKSSLAGEVVQIGAPVFTVIDLNSIWVTAYINETDLGRVKLDQEAYVVTDTYPGKRYKGRVSFVSSEGERFLAWSARTAPARLQPCACLPAYSIPQAAKAGFTTNILQKSPKDLKRISLTCPSASDSTKSSPCWKI